MLIIGVTKMYPYHNKIKQRIKNGELIGYEYVQKYPRIGECLLLHFSSQPYIRPIRPHKYGEYANVLEEWEKSQADN